MRRVAGVVVAVGLVVTGCGGDDGDGAEAPTTATTTTTTTATSTTAPPDEPAVREIACDDTVSVPPGTPLDCGELTVPADRAHPDGGEVTIPYAVWRSEAPDRQPDPIIYFSGGPGFEGRGIIGFLGEIGIAGGRRDVIVFDQRGTGAATPSLDCPEVTEVVWQQLGAAEQPAAEARAAHDALRACRDRLVAEGVDLDTYDTPTTAADVEDLRTALGIDTWNLLGVSYGTTVALEVVRQHPESVRSVVLDSVYPTDVPNDADAVVEHARRALGTLAEGCRADAACAAANGEVSTKLDELREAWNATPYETTVTDPATGQPRALAVTGDDVVAGAWNAMYDSSLLGVLPSLLQPLLDRSPVADGVVAQIASGGIDQLTGAAEGIAVGVNCADRQRLDRRPDATVLAAEPTYASLLTLGAGTECELWDVEPVDPSFNEPVVSDRPALVMGDEYDPVTPPEDSRRTAEGFADGTYVELPGLGHGAIFAHECPRSIYLAFVDDPAAAVDTSCVGAMGPPAWVTG